VASGAQQDDGNRVKINRKYLKTPLLYIVCCVCILSACNSTKTDHQSTSKVRYTLRPKPKVDTAQQRQIIDSLYQRLEMAYETKSIDQLSTFVQDWADYSAKQTKTYPVSDTIAQALSQIFMTMLSSHDSTLVAWKTYQHQKLFAGAKYLLIQVSVPYSIGFAKDAHQDTLRNFSLPVKYPNLTILYCHEVYQQAFDRFLAKDIDYSKKGFLSKILTLPPWAISGISSQASIENIQLNPELTGAVVEYYVANRIIKSWLVKQGADWVIVRSTQSVAEYD
jgi:hypothetical protein